MAETFGDLLREVLGEAQDAYNRATGSTASTPRLRRDGPVLSTRGVGDPPRRTFDYGPNGAMRTRTPFSLASTPGPAADNPAELNAMRGDAAASVISNRLGSSPTPDFVRKMDPGMFENMADAGLGFGARGKGAAPADAPSGSFMPQQTPAFFNGAMRAGTQETLDNLTLPRFLRGTANHTLDPDAMRRVSGPSAMLREPPALRPRPSVTSFDRAAFGDIPMGEAQPQAPRPIAPPFSASAGRQRPTLQAPFSGVQVMDTPEQAQNLPSGTRYRTPDGRVFVR